MTSKEIHCSFGPVPSRRLGKSIGVNNIPPKTCSYSCVYCQAGKTTLSLNTRSSFYDPKAIFVDVQKRLSKAKQALEPVDYITFVPDGEPTLDINLGKEIQTLKSLGKPIGVISNGSLLWREDVRTELNQADWVSLKIDALREEEWRRINRPRASMDISEILEGALAFASSYPGKLVSETMAVKGINDNECFAGELADFLFKLQPSIAYISVPTRPPAEEWAVPPDGNILNMIYLRVAEKVERAEFLTAYEGDDFAYMGDIEKDILGITSVHPLREEALLKLLNRAGASRRIVERLVEEGALIKMIYKGRLFYSRSFKKTNSLTKEDEGNR